MKTRSQARSNGVSFTMVFNEFGYEIMAQSWEVGEKIYTLLVKVSKIRVVFGYFGGRTELY